MTHKIPIDFIITHKDSGEQYSAYAIAELSDRAINEIVAFINDNHFTGELPDMPAKHYDKIMNALERDIYRTMRKLKVDWNDVNVGYVNYLSPELVSLFPEETAKRLDWEKILEAYEVDSREEYFEQIITFEEKPAETGPFIKTLAIRQPWATLIACGVKDIECRDAMKTKCRKIFIAASSTKVAWHELDEYVQKTLLELERKGIIPPYNQLPQKCIIGYVDIVDVTYDNVDSIWGRNWDGIKYVLRNAHELDEPITGKNKATPYFYNVYGYDEEHLPAAHVVDLTDIELPS